MNTLRDKAISAGPGLKTFLSPPHFERHLTGLSHAEIGADLSVKAFYLDGSSEFIDDAGDWLDKFGPDECPGAIEICAFVQSRRL